MPPLIGRSPGGGALSAPLGKGGVLFANTIENVSIRHTLKKYLRFFLFIFGVGVHKKYINTWYKYNIYYYKTIIIWFN